MTVAAGKRGHNVSRAHLADRAMFVRLETLRLARICGAGHYSSTFSAAELFGPLKQGLCLAIRGEGREIVGLLLVMDDRVRDAFSPDDVALLESLAVQVGVVMSAGR